MAGMLFFVLDFIEMNLKTPKFSVGTHPTNSVSVLKVIPETDKSCTLEQEQHGVMHHKWPCMLLVVAYLCIFSKNKTKMPPKKTSASRLNQ